MKTIPFFALIALALFTFSACEKGGDVVDPPSNTELLADGPWELTAQTVDPPINVGGIGCVGGTPVSNEYAQLDACVTDNIINFTETGTFTDDEGDTKCDASDPQLVRSGTWSFSDAETKLTLDADNSSTVFTVTTLDRDKLVITETFSGCSNLTYTRTYTYQDIN